MSGGGTYAAGRGDAAHAGAAAQRLVTAFDRSKAIRRSRRHTLLVRLLRLMLPAVAMLTLGAYYLTLRTAWTIDIGNGKASVEAFRITKDNLAMETPKYQGFTKDGGRFKVVAKSGVQDFKQPDRIVLKHITGDLVQPTGVTTNLTAVNGIYDHKKNELELWEDIVVTTSTGMHGLFSRAMVYVKDNRIVSKEPVRLDGPNGTIAADSMQLNQKTQEALFEGGVRVRLQRPPAGEAKAGSAGRKPAAAAPELQSGVPLRGQLQ